MKFKELVFFVVIFIAGCAKPPIPNYYYKLGQVECKYASVNERMIRMLSSENFDSIEYAKLNIEFEKAYLEMEEFKHKYWDDMVLINKSYTQKEAELERKEGYSNCNCDTCMFKTEFSKLDNIKKLKQI